MRRIDLIKEYSTRFWNSPTLMTWASLITKSVSLVIVLPLILTRLKTAEIALWYLFMSIIALQSVVDAGFSPTFTRVIAYVMGGAGLHELKQPIKTDSNNFNRKTLNQVYSTMKTVFLYLGLIWTLLLILVGTAALIKPINSVADPKTAWLAWGIIVVVSCLSLQGNLYASYLQGINQIALFRRWEALTALTGIISSILVMITGGGLLGLVIANQGWQLISIIRNRWLAGKAENGIIRSFVKEPFNKIVYDAVWPSAWRSGLGVLMCYGLIHASGIIYAQLGNPASVAAYLLGLRLISTVTQFSQAPFYSKLPLFARLYAESRREELVCLAQRGMAFAYWSYVASFVALGLAGPHLLKLIGSNAQFPDQLLWSLLGIGFFIERYGAMHIQLYSTTNHIIWHIANGITGIVFIVSSLLTYNLIDIYAFPVSIIVGYLGFYFWYASIHSYRAFNLNFRKFEMRSSVMPMCIIILYSLSILLMLY